MEKYMIPQIAIGLTAVGIAYLVGKNYASSTPDEKPEDYEHTKPDYVKYMDHVVVS